jgi:hypothetical protein
MAGVKGRSGTNRNKDKPFAEALRMEIAAAGDDHKALRAIARNLLALAQINDTSALAAIAQVADRLDGKPAQEATLMVTRVTATDIGDDELADIATGSSEGTAPSTLN